MPEKLTQERIAELRATTPRAGLDDIGAEVTGDGNPEIIEDLQAYLHGFAARKRDAQGNLRDGNPCLVCDQPLQGGFASMLTARGGGFQWGIAHGSGHCGECGYPGIAYHFVKDRHGADLMTFRHVVLQPHPEFISIRENVDA